MRGENLLSSDYDCRQVEARFWVNDADMGDADHRLAAAVLLFRPQKNDSIPSSPLG